MKKLLLTTAIVMVMGSTAAFEHHPAEEFVDPDIYAMIDENVNSQPFMRWRHRFDFDMEAIASDFGNAGLVTGGDLEDVGAEMAGEIDVEAAMESREEANAMANAEPGGPASAQR